MIETMVLTVIICLTLWVLCSNLVTICQLKGITDTIRKGFRVAFLCVVSLVATVSWTAASAINSEIPDTSTIKINGGHYYMEVVKVNNP